MKLNEAVAQCHRSLARRGIKLEASELRRKIKGEFELFDISVREAAAIIEEAELSRAICGPRNKPPSLSDEGSSDSDIEGASSPSIIQTTSLSTLPPRRNVTIEAEIDSLWDIPNPDIQHRGVLADSTGFRIFTVWKNGNHQQLEEGEAYRFQTAITDEQEDCLVVNVTPRSAITHIDSEVTLPDSTRFEALGTWGVIVDIEKPSGIIYRCPESNCSHTLSSKICPTHGQMETAETDMRVKAVLDDGENTERVVFNREHTKELLDVTRSRFADQVKNLPETMPQTDLIEEDLIGKHLSLIGLPLDGALFVGEYRESPPSNHYDLPATDQQASRG